MSLSDKMFRHSSPGCGFGTDCRKESDRRHFDDLFASVWEVFVIKHDREKGKFDWFTLCCEAAEMITNATSNTCSQVGC
jgi:hypothetical protein